jgi:hypothetical protein
MPYSERAAELTRGTLCWTKHQNVEMRLMCPDRIPPNGSVPLAVFVTRRGETLEGVGMTLRLTFSGTGRVTFDRAGGPTEKTLNGNVFALFELFGGAATSSAAPDVTLEVELDGETYTDIRLSVAAPSGQVEIKAENGTDAPAASLNPGATARFKAVPSGGIALPGQFQWMSVEPAALVIEGRAPNAARGETVEVSARAPVLAHRTLAVLFRPDGGGPAVMAVHRLQAEYKGRVEDRSVAPEYREAGTAHIFPAIPFTIVDAAGTQVHAGTLNANGRFQVLLPPAGRYELRVPGFEGLTL